MLQALQILTDRDLRSGIVKAQASSAGKIKIGVTEELTAAASSGAKFITKVHLVSDLVYVKALEEK